MKPNVLRAVRRPTRVKNRLQAAAVRKDDRPVRAELVERVRKEIAAGTYDTPEKLEVALGRLLARFAD